MRVLSPIVIDENGSLEVYPNESAACADIEAVDVRNGEFQAFDAAGHMLELVTTGEQVSLSEGAQLEAYPEELRRRIQRFVLASGLNHQFPGDFAQSPLPDILEWLMEIQRGVPSDSHASSVKNSVRRALRRLGRAADSD